MLYSRVAHDDGMVLTAQENLLRRWAMENGYAIVGETTETGSGIRPDRPGLSAVMQAVRGKRMDAIIVKDLGRLTRRYMDMPRYIKMFQANDVALISIDDGPLLDFAAICL